MATDAFDDQHGLSGAYALDSLEPLERARFERHLDTCAACQAEVADFRETAAMLAAVVAEVAPPAELRTRVLAGIGATRQQAPDDVPAPRTPAPVPTTSPTMPDRAETAGDPGGDTDDTVVPLRRRRWVSVVAAAAVALVVGVGVGVTQPWTDDDGSSQIADSQRTISRVLAADDAETIRQPLGGGTAEIVRSVSVGRAVVVFAGVRAPSDRVYQLWLLRGQTPTSAGVMPTGSDQTVLLAGDASTAQQAAISTEPPGGSSTPTLSPLPAFFEFSTA